MSPIPILKLLKTFEFTPKQKQDLKKILLKRKQDLEAAIKILGVARAKKRKRKKR
jgi:hypothetical protein